MRSISLKRNKIFGTLFCVILACALSLVVTNNCIPVKASDGFSLLAEGCTIYVYCSNATVTVDSRVTCVNSSVVGFPLSVDMNRTEFELVQSISLMFSATGSVLVYTFANTTDTNARSNSDATKSSLEAAFNTSFTWHSSSSSYGYFFNETYHSPAKENLTAYTQFAMSLCLASDLGGFSSTFTGMIQKPNATLVITASKQSGTYDWTYSMEVAYPATVLGGSGGHKLDLLELLNVTSIAPSPYAGGEEYMSVLLIIYTNATVSYVSSEPSLAPTSLSRGWTSTSYIPQMITAFFSFGNDTSEVNRLSYTFDGVVVPEFSACSLIILFVAAIAVAVIVRAYLSENKRRSPILSARQQRLSR